MEAPDYKIGDSVIIGHRGKVHWVIKNLYSLPSPGGERVLILESPMSSRTSVQLERYVRPWSPGE